MSILNEILEYKKKEVQKLKEKYSLSSFREMEFFDSNNLSLINSINSENNISIIAELKKQSPSKGIINNKFDYKNIVSSYFNSNIVGVSVLTDEKYFGGKISLLKELSLIKKKPLLRKDFIIDTYQVYQSKAFGADVILLICEALTKNQIKDFTCLAKEIGLEVLLELHSTDQISKINFQINKLIGINNRNLTDFKVDIYSTLKIIKHLPDNITIVSESGINKKEDLELLKSTNVNAVLVGEYLMSSNYLSKDLRNLEEWCKIES